MTLQELKDSYAREREYKDWYALYRDCAFNIGTFENHMDNILLLAQQEALKNASETCRIEKHNTATKDPIEYLNVFSSNGIVYLISKDLITSETNLIK